MRKRCTNSSCRREFFVEGKTAVSCPHCGWRYPRLNGKAAAAKITARNREDRGWSVTLRYAPRKAQVFHAIRKATDMGLRQMGELLRSCPSIVCSGMTLAEARKLAAELNAAGAVAEVKKLTNREMQYYYTA